ncbi:MAG TPA: creatininase family protein [Candidatus Binatia bacterium]|nr:creatininase family protein [Candidatus Binatia bacterium]
MKLAELHWPEVKELDRKNIVVVVPVGSMEQHGPHLPFQVDVFVSSRLAEDPYYFSGVIIIIGIRLSPTRCL